MKNIFLLFIALSISTHIFSQKIYNTTSGELIFGTSNSAYNAPNPNSDLLYGNTNGSTTGPIRFTLWFHFGTYWHYDFNNSIGIYTGIANRNIGFITDEANSTGETTDNVKWKRRTYSIGVPLAIKIGSFDDDYYFFAGAQYELLYHYKEKEFTASGKRKYTEWFSPRTNRFLPSVFVGVSFPKGLSLKFTYALADMMNANYTFTDGAGMDQTPYKFMDSRLMYLSVYQMMKWDKDTYKKIDDDKKQVAFL